MKTITDPAILKNIRATGLYEMIQVVQKYKPDFKVLEIGCFEGQSSEIFAITADHVYCVDPWESGYDDNDMVSRGDLSHAEREFDKRMSKYNNFVKIKKKSTDAANNFEDNTFDLVYIDGLHTYEGVTADINAWISKVKPTGFIGGHDYGAGWGGVVQAVQEQFKSHIIRKFPDTSWLVKPDGDYDTPIDQYKL
jgi:SAM-dependent methyltransferase